nr:hypothetical protein [Tanacetum cinerariifolium]
MQAKEKGAVLDAEAKAFLADVECTSPYDQPLFWNTVTVKQSTDVTRLQALADKKKVLISKAVIRDVLRLDDAEGVDCLPNEESLSAKRMSWNEFSSAMASVVICLSTCRKFNFSKYIFDSLVRNVDSSSKFYMYPRFIQLIIQNQLGDLSTHTTTYISPALTQKVFANIKRERKGFSGVETPLFEGMLVVGEIEEHGNEEERDNDDNDAQGANEDVSGDDVQDQFIPSPAPPTLPPSPQAIPSTSHVQSPPPQPQSPTPTQPQGADFPMSLLQEALDACAALTRRVEHLEHDKRIESSDDTIMKDVINQGRMIDELDRDEGVALMGEKEEEKKAKEVKVIAGDAHVEGRQAEIQAEIYQIDMNHPLKVLSMHEEEPEVQEVAEVVTTAKLITEVVAAASTPVSVVSTIILVVEPNIPTATITAALVKVAAASTRRRRGVVIRDPEEESSAKTFDETKSKDKGKGIMVEDPKPMKKKQQVKMDEAYARKLHKELNQDIDWDVAIEHNTTGFKLDYFKGKSYDDIRPIFEAKFNTNMEFLLKSKEQIEEEENRALESINETPAQKAAKRRRLNQEDKDVEEIKQHLEIMPDEDDDVYTEATPLARKNFDREDLESLWSLVEERFSTLKPNNFSDDYLLTTLRAIFGKPDRQDNVWKSQRSVHGHAMKNTKSFNAAGEELSAVKHKLMLLHTAAERRVNTAK